MNESRTCYGCAGSGRRGIFECAVCNGTGKLSGPVAQAHADSFRHATLRNGGAKRSTEPRRTPVIRVRKRRIAPDAKR